MESSIGGCFRLEQAYTQNQHRANENVDVSGAVSVPGPEQHSREGILVNQDYRSRPTSKEPKAAMPADDIADELWAANKRLLLAGLDAQERAEEAQSDLTYLNALFGSLSEAITMISRAGSCWGSSSTAT